MKHSLRVLSIALTATLLLGTVTGEPQCKQYVNCFHGTCNGDVCECTCFPALGRWGGDQCLTWAAGASDCSDELSSGSDEPTCQQNVNCFHGSCNGDTCECSCYPSLGRWTGDDCLEWVPGTSDCSAALQGQAPLCSQNENCFHGTCDAAGTCQCRSFPGMGSWTGEQCDQWEAAVPAGTGLVVRVVDAVSKSGIEGATVALLHVTASGTSPLDSETSDVMGFAAFKGVPVDDMAIVVVSGVAGYPAASVTVTLSEVTSTISVPLSPATYSTTVTYSESSSLEFSDAGGVAPAFSVSFPPGFLPSELDGKTLRLEATLASDAAPGTPSLVAALDTAGARVSLETLGMMELTITDVDSGERVHDFTSGLTAEVAFEVRAADTMAALGIAIGDAVPLWHFDEAAGVWEQKGTGQLTQKMDGTVMFQFAAPSFSWWNCDAPWSDTSCVTVTTCKDLPGPCEPFPFAEIDVVGVGYTLSTRYGRTGADGTACVNVKKGSTNDFSASSFGESSAVATVASSDNPSACPDSRQWLQATAASGSLEPCAEVELRVPLPSCVTFALDTSAVPDAVSELRIFATAQSGSILPGTQLLSRPFPASFCVEAARSTTISVSAFGVYTDGWVRSVGSSTELAVPSTSADIAGGCGACADSGYTMTFEVVDQQDVPTACMGIPWNISAPGNPPAANLPVYVYYQPTPADGLAYPAFDCCRPGQENMPEAWTSEAVFGGVFTTGDDGVALVDVPLEFIGDANYQMIFHIGGCSDSLPDYFIDSFYVTDPSPGWYEGTWPLDGYRIGLFENPYGPYGFYNQWQEMGAPTGRCADGTPAVTNSWPYFISGFKLFSPPGPAQIPRDFVFNFAQGAEESAAGSLSAGSASSSSLAASSVAMIAAAALLLLAAVVLVVVRTRRSSRADAAVEGEQIAVAEGFAGKGPSAEMAFFVKASDAAPDAGHPSAAHV